MDPALLPSPDAPAPSTPTTPADRSSAVLYQVAILAAAALLIVSAAIL